MESSAFTFGLINSIFNFALAENLSGLKTNGGVAISAILQQSAH